MKKAFTMIELVFVIVIVGILVAVVIPNTKTNSIQEAAVQILSHIRYTQYLAMMNDKYDTSKTKWFRERWQIFFSTANSTISYVIFSESLSLSGAYDGNPYANSTYTRVEVALDPLNKDKYLVGTTHSSFDNSSSSKISNRLNLTNTYGIKDIKVIGGTPSLAKRIQFDNLGRPYKGTTSSTLGASSKSPYDRIAKSEIFIKLCIDTCTGNNKKSNNDKEIVISIQPETGYCKIEI